MTRPLAKGYKACFEFHGPLMIDWHRSYWSMTRADGAGIITARTDNDEANLTDRLLTFVPAADDWQYTLEGCRFIGCCHKAMRDGVPVRVILRDREHKAKPWVDPRFYWGIITYVGTGQNQGHIRGKLLALDAYDPESNTFKGN